MPIDDEIETRIEGAPLSAHLATAVDDRPHVAPVWYGYRDGTIYAITGGRKFENVRRNPRVAVSIEGGDGRGGVEWNVTLLGRATVVADPARIEEAEGWIYDAYEGHGTDGGADEGEGFDPGEPGEDYGLLEIAVASGTLQVY